VTDTWAALAGGSWAGPIRFDADGRTYAGALRLLDVDEDERVVHAHAQARALRGWGGVAAAMTLRPDGAGCAIDDAATLAGSAGEPARAALLDAVRARVDAAVRALEPSPADDPAFRRRLAGRAALAVALGVAAGLAGAAWDRRRRA
jgi:hypothetical protein